jgi:hypothetical protein
MQMWPLVRAAFGPITGESEARDFALWSCDYWEWRYRDPANEFRDPPDKPPLPPPHLNDS